MTSSTQTRKDSQKTVKAFETDIALINEQARATGCTAAEVIHNMCEQLRKQTYLQEISETFELLRSKSEHFAEFEAENKAWDCTLADGLDDAS